MICRNGSDISRLAQQTSHSRFGCNVGNSVILSGYASPEVFGEGDTVPVPLLVDLAIDMGKVFTGLFR